MFHLIKRGIGSVSRVAPNQSDINSVSAILNADEFALWSHMQPQDQRHSILVLQRFDDRAPYALRSERAGALLHDVGKNVSNLGVMLRVIATIFGSRGRRFSEYHNHEQIGAAMLHDVSDQRTIDLVSGKAVDDVACALRAADNI